MKERGDRLNINGNRYSNGQKWELMGIKYDIMYESRTICGWRKGH